MPPILALTLTLIFILFLLRLDRKQGPTVSNVSWIPTFWILLITSKALGIWTGIGGGNNYEGSPLDRNVLSGLAVIGVLILIKRNFNFINIIKNNFWLMLIIVFMLTSVLWSEAPFLSFKRWIRGECVMIIMACLVASEVNPQQTLMSIFRRIAYVHMPLSLLLIKYYPYLGVEFGRWTGEVSWNGVSTQKNGLAQLCVFSLFFLFWTFIRRRQGLDKSVIWYHMYAELTVVMLALWLVTGPRHTFTYSSTATATFVIGVIALLFLLWMKSKNKILNSNLLTLSVLFIIIYGTVTPFLGGLAIFDVSSLLQRDASLTGRSEIWAKLIPIVMEKPFLGHGFCYWTEELSLLTKTTGSHNGYLETILSLGFIGLILSSIFLITTCRKAGREMVHNFDWGALWFCMILMAVIHDITEASLDTFTGFYPMIIFFQISTTNTKLQSIQDIHEAS